MTSIINADQLATLDRDGFVVLRGVLSDESVRNYAQLLNSIADAHLERWLRITDARRARTPLEDDDGRLYRGGIGVRFDAADERFVELFDHPVARDVVDAALSGAYRAVGGAFAAFPGEGHDGINNDLVGDAGPLGSWKQINLTWAITAFSAAENGPMRAVPRSHRGEFSPPEFDEVGGIRLHPDEVRIEANAGDLVVNCSHLWKADSFNAGTTRRLGIWVSYGLQSLKPDDPVFRWNAEKLVSRNPYIAIERAE